MPLPVNCLQVLFSDLLDVKKSLLTENTHATSAIDIDSTIENIREKLISITEKEIQYNEFSDLLFHN